MGKTYGSQRFSKPLLILWEELNSIVYHTCFDDDRFMRREALYSLENDNVVQFFNIILSKIKERLCRINTTYAIEIDTVALLS